MTRALGSSSVRIAEEVNLRRSPQGGAESLSLSLAAETKAKFTISEKGPTGVDSADHKTHRYSGMTTNGKDRLAAALGESYPRVWRGLGLEKEGVNLTPKGKKKSVRK